MGNVNSNKELYRRLLIRLILGLLYTGLLLVVFPRVIRLLYPFVFALILAVILNPLVTKVNKAISKLNKTSSGSRKIITLILNLLILLAISSLIFYLGYTIIREAISFSLSIQKNWPSIVLKLDSFQDKFSWLLNMLPEQVIQSLDGFKENILEFVKNISRNILTSSISVTATLITGAGTFFINFLTFFLAMYFFISDYHILDDLVNKYSNNIFFKTLSIVKSSIISALGGYIKAQLILGFFAFVFMFVSLSIYGQSHALIIALFLGIIDLLPLIGTIAVLLPWGIIELIGGDINKGVFLIVLGVLFFLIRRIIEPKVMGSQTGLHPLLALMSTYVGLQISGVWGAILGPLVFMLVISIVKSGIFKDTLADLKMLFIQVSKILQGRRKN